MDSNDSVLNEILANDLSRVTNNLGWKPLEFASVVRKFGLEPGSFFAISRTKSLRNSFGKLSDIFMLVGGRYSLTRLILARI